jgi:predicted aspartyl protease
VKGVLKVTSGLMRRVQVRYSQSLIAFVLSLLLLTGCYHQPNFTPTTVTLYNGTPATSPITIPIELPHRGIPAMLIDGPNNPSIAVLDTGAAANLVSPQFAKKHNLDMRKVPNLRIVDALGKHRNAPDVAHVSELKVGDATFHDFDVMVDESVRGMNDHTDVMLGAPLFDNVLVTIDYARRRLVLQPGESLPPVNNQDILPLRKTKDGHLQVQAKLLGEEAWLILDTGHTGDGLTLSRFRLIALPWASTPVEAGQIQTMLGRHAMRAGRMDGDITLGQFTLQRPIVSIGFTDDDEFIGADTLQHFAVTIDQKNNRLRFRAAEGSDVIHYPPVRRLGFDIRDRRGTIKVTPGSNAEKSGLRDGDIFLSLNDVSFERFNYRYYEHLERLGEPMTLKIRREGKDLTLIFPPTVVIP